MTSMQILWFLVAMAVLTWFYFLYTILSYKNVDPVERLTWVIVLLALPVVGVFFYVFIQPFKTLVESNKQRSKLDRSKKQTPHRNRLHNNDTHAYLNEKWGHLNEEAKG